MFKRFISLCAISTLILVSCKKNEPTNYGYLLVSNQYDVDIRAHAEDPYNKIPDTYDFVFSSYTETIERMTAGGYVITWTIGDKAPWDGITRISIGDTTAIIFEYPK